MKPLLFGIGLSERRAAGSFFIIILFLILLLIGFVSHAKILDCEKFKFPKCSASDYQYDQSLRPSVGFGGFGGGRCKATKIPVIFIHGNADRAVSWDSDVVATPGFNVVQKNLFMITFDRGDITNVSYLA